MNFRMAGGGVVESWNWTDGYLMINPDEEQVVSYWWPPGEDHGLQLASVKEHISTVLMVLEQGIEGFVDPNPPHQRRYKYYARIKNVGQATTFYTLVGGGVT